MMEEVQLASSYQPKGNGELVMCIPKGGLQEFISFNTFPLHLEYDIMTLFAATKTLAIYKPGGDFSPVTTAHENLGYKEADIWTPQELSTYNSEILFMRGLAKMAVAAMSYKIEYLIREESNISDSNKQLRNSIVSLSTERKSAMNYLRSRTKIFTSTSKSFNAQDSILRIVATCYHEFLSDVPHPKRDYEDNGQVRRKCLGVTTKYPQDSVLLKELLVPPGNKKADELSLAFVVDEILFSGNM